MSEALRKVTIKGFKSIRSLSNFELRSLNVLIGANGAGKSNFISFFSLLRALLGKRLLFYVDTAGGADVLLHLGPSHTRQIIIAMLVGEQSHEFNLAVTVDNRLVFKSERIHYSSTNVTERWDPVFMAGESLLLPKMNLDLEIYHFHDTSETAGFRRWGGINDNERLRLDGSNLAAYLFRLHTTNPEIYRRIRDVVRLAAPFFDDFKLRPIPTNPDMIQLEWTQRDSDYPFRPSQLSDGTLRFICLATALLQDAPPSLSLFDEPELGLHPTALSLLANLFQQAAGQNTVTQARQVVVSTQSPQLVDEFQPEDIVVVERHHGESTFQRLDATTLHNWLQEYSLGELWQKNVLGGKPGSESAPQFAPAVDP